MSLLHTYKELVGKVYTLIQRASRQEDTATQFDDFLDHLAKALERTVPIGQSIHIPPHLEIIHEKSENVIVVKDDNHKNIVVRHTPGAQIDTIIEDEELTNEENVIVSNYPDDETDALEAEELAQMAADEVAEELAQEADIEEPEEKEEEEEEEEEKEEETDEEDDGEEELEPITIKRRKYFVAVESKRVYEFIDDSTPGKQVGKLQNGNLITI
jgi:type IV secretory pathway VirB9-like protein